MRQYDWRNWKDRQADRKREKQKLRGAFPVRVKREKDRVEWRKRKGEEKAD